MFIRSAYNYDRREASVACGLSCDPALGKTQQQFKDECDIMTIVKRFGVTGQVPGTLKVPKAGDFTGITDFHSAMNMVREAQEAFQEVPSDVRKRFGNDPQAFFEFFNDSANADELIRMGLAKKPDVPRPADPVAPAA